MRVSVGEVARACAWPRCPHDTHQRVLRLNPRDAGSRGRPRLYCSESCRVAAQKRRRTLRAALSKIEDELHSGALGLPRSHVSRWRDLVEWELAVLDAPAGFGSD